MGEGIFDFCLSYVLYFCLQVKKGLLHDDRTKSIMFLQAVHDPAYIDVITTLQVDIDTSQSKDFGYLPPTLSLMSLSAQMNKNAKARVRDILPCARRVEWHPDDRPAMTPCIQGFHLPQVYPTDFSQDWPQQEAWTHGCPGDGRNIPHCQMDGTMQCSQDSLMQSTIMVSKFKMEYPPVKVGKASGIKIGQDNTPDVPRPPPQPPPPWATWMTCPQVEWAPSPHVPPTLLEP